MLELKGKYCKDCRVYIDEVEDSAMTLIYDILDCPAFNDAKIRIMPDVHAGKGIVIGFTSPVGDFINPDHVGVDIGCTIDCWFTDVDVSAVDLWRLERDIRKTVKFGQDYQETTQTTVKNFCSYVNGLLRTWRSAWPERIQPVKVTEKFITEFCRRLNMDEKTFWKSLGSVGSGNHYIEVSKNCGKLVYSIHCGSRNLGVKIAKYHNKVAKNTSKNKEFKKERDALIKTLKDSGRQREIPEALEQLHERQQSQCIEGYLSGSEMSDYLTDMAFGVAYAQYNHEVISKLIMSCIKKQVPKAKVTDMVRSIHNYVDFTDHVIRKGAIRAYEGECCVIPFNMRDGLAICRGKSNLDWNCSAPHGAGRVMSRAAAKKNLSVDEFCDQMSGIISTSVGAGTIDEAPAAYKPTDLILSLIGDTVDILYLIKPLINLKDKNTANED